MTRQPQHQDIVQSAERAIRSAQQVRDFHRKRTKVGSGQRNTDIRNAEQQIRKVMKPIRSALGRAPYDPDNEATRTRHDELRRLSQRVQTERRKLWKLRTGGKR